MEDEDREIEKARHKIRNKSALNDDNDYSIAYRKILESLKTTRTTTFANIRRDARTVIISKRQEREEAKPYFLFSNYRIIDDHPKPARKRANIRAHDSEAGPSRPAPLLQ